MTDFDPYHKWLGIPKKRQPRTLYDLLGVSLDEEDSEVIRAAAQQRRQFVESQKGRGKDRAVGEILYQLSEAETTLLNPTMRRDYDQRMKLFHKRRRNRRIDPIANRSHIESAPGRMVGEESGLFREFAGIVTVLSIAFIGMLVVAFWIPWGKLPSSSPNVAVMPVVEATDPLVPAEQQNAVPIHPWKAQIAELESQIARWKENRSKLKTVLSQIQQDRSAILERLTQLGINSTSDVGSNPRAVILSGELKDILQQAQISEKKHE